MPPRLPGRPIALIWDYCTSLGGRSYRPPTVHLNFGADVFGCRDTVIRRLSASFGSYTTLKQGESIVKYEKPLNPNLNLQGSAPVSKFTR